MTKLNCYLNFQDNAEQAFNFYKSVFGGEFSTMMRFKEVADFPGKEKLVNELAPIVTEEWGHFRLVLQELQKRNLPLGKQRKDIYVNKLIEFQHKGGSPEDRLLDHLLTMALIEARSCERFKRLSEGLEDEYMRKFYRRFMESEAGHYTLFIELADTYLPKERVRKRWKEWLAYEKILMNYLCEIFIGFNIGIGTGISIAFRI